MQSNWSKVDAESLVSTYAKDGIHQDIALCVYMTRLLGKNHKLVLHGGGNTSVKMQALDILGKKSDIMFVKQSGTNMETAIPSDFPALRLNQLQQYRGFRDDSEFDIQSLQRSCLVDGNAGDPSIETFMHAFLPHKFIAHSHANAVLSVTNQSGGTAIAEQIYKNRAIVIPYAMPGLGLAQLVSESYFKSPGSDGLILACHGIVSFSDDARTAYENMIKLVTLAEEAIRLSDKSPTKLRYTPSVLKVGDIAPVIRGTYSRARSYYAKNDSMKSLNANSIISFRTSPQILKYLNGEAIDRYANRGVATPDHVIHTRNKPMIFKIPETIESLRESMEVAFKEFINSYADYIDRNINSKIDSNLALDLRPRVILLQNLGLIGLGQSKAEADVAADIAEATIDTISGAEVLGEYCPASEKDIFAIESWPVEQSKLAPPKGLLAGQIAIVTGGAGTIGQAIVREFSKAGASIAALDIDEGKVQKIASQFPDNVIGIACDVTDENSVNDAFRVITEEFGGIDILISNAGAAWQGRISDVDDKILAESFDINFFAHQRMARHAVKLMRVQGNGGCLLFNVSKQAINPGINFGPYGLPKAATLFLVRQYALYHGHEGIRSNAVNADRVRSGLLTEDMIKTRALARGVSEAEYMSGNLLGVEVEPMDIAHAFLRQALAQKTTGDVHTVDGGNISAVLR